MGRVRAGRGPQGELGAPAAAGQRRAAADSRLLSTVAAAAVGWRWRPADQTGHRSTYGPGGQTRQVTGQTKILTDKVESLVM